jgi:UDP-glucose 4-epimerase
MTAKGVVLITGGAGFIGSHTAEHLLEEGHRVIVADNLRTGRLENLAHLKNNPALEFHRLDITHPGALLDLAKRSSPTAIIHLAGLVSVAESISNPELNAVLNVGGTEKVAETAHLCGTLRVVFASSAAVYGNNQKLPLTESVETSPTSPYGMAKAASEALLLSAGAASGFSVSCLRYFNVIGSRQRPDSPYTGVVSIFADCCRKARRPILFGDGHQTRDFIHVRDVARANTLAATGTSTASGCFNICRGEETSLLDLLLLMKAHAPHLPTPEFRAAREGDILRSVGDPRLARSVLGFAYREDLKTSIAELIAAAE